MTERIEKSLAHRLATLLAPECGEVLSGFRAKRDGWVKMPAELELIRKNLGIGEIYVLTYEDENRIWNCLFRGIFPENTVEKFKKLDDEFFSLSEEEKFALFDDDAVASFNNELEISWGEIFPKTEDAKEAARKKFEALSDDEKKAATYSAVMFVAFFYAYFYNMIPLMVHGQKLTTLELPAHQQDMVLFALQTGLRQSNVVKLEWSQINLEQGHMWVNAAQSKNRKPIAVPLNREALAVLHRQLGKHSARVFTFAGQPIANANTRAWRNALKRAGIEDFRWHDLRHTWASWHRMQGTPTHELQQLGGWKTGAMVERYAHLAPDHLANAAARLDSVLNGYDLATIAKK